MLQQTTAEPVPAPPRLTTGNGSGHVWAWLHACAADSRPAYMYTYVGVKGEEGGWRYKQKGEEGRVGWGRGGEGGSGGVGKGEEGGGVGRYM